ncbi:hypothetical protein QA612_04835 [Evansella sp. AB-P1]|uniref:hypothetical protein n=1 Tax=Evansella sp. AB-P1 TaxID=3037653 RepID=UPI00241C842C|nr:hypothetical protein [Evansella sp. AB-P1]MDG5786808.1 hypothetical protein [Evansella sp. AB-P1]
MKFIYVLAVGAVIVFIVYFELHQKKEMKKKEKVVFFSLTAFAYGLAIMIIFFPEIYGPTQFISHLFEPLAFWLLQ